MPDGRSITTAINSLLSLPFALKIATRDYHPSNHVSFAANHPSSAPFASSTVIKHASDPSKSYTTTLWPIHCVQGTPGVELIPELRADLLHGVLDKGMDPSVEMYSAFYDPFHVSDSGLAKRLKSAGVTDVFVVGLATDYCVAATAEHAVDEGFNVFVVEEATKPVVPDKLAECQLGLVAKGVKLVHMDGQEIARVRSIS